MNQDRAENVMEIPRRIDRRGKGIRHAFLRQFDSSIQRFDGSSDEIPGHGLIFRHEEIDRLLIDSIHCNYGDDDPQNDHKARKRLIRFLIRAGYTDEVVDPENIANRDEVEPRILRRTTAIHHAAKLGFYDLVEDLFKIYKHFGVNCSDASGLTHLHAATMAGCFDAVARFLELGHDVNYRWPKTKDTPLHMALLRNRDMITQLLLDYDADPFRLNDQRVAPMRLIGRRPYLPENDPLMWFLTNSLKSFVEDWTMELYLRKSGPTEDTVITCAMIVDQSTSETLWTDIVMPLSQDKDVYYDSPNEDESDSQNGDGYYSQDEDESD
ncbi:hypothetical protein TKK_0010611 [Trichogramma kaykai]